MQIVNIIVCVRKFFQDILTYCILVDLIIVRSFPVKRTIPGKTQRKPIPTDETLSPFVHCIFKINT